MKTEEKKCIVFKGVELNGDFSPAVLRWLKFYDSLSPEQQMMISYEPKELIIARKRGLKIDRELSVTITIDEPQINSYDQSGHLIFDNSRWDACSQYGNCYAYAMNVLLSTKNESFTPGVLSGNADIASGTDIMTAKDQLIENLFADVSSTSLGKVVKLRACSDREPSGINEYKIALVLAPISEENNEFFDFHFYREDSDQNWSHKRGLYYVTRKDNSDIDINSVYTPQRCNRKYGDTNYSLFAGYFMVTHSE